MCISPLFVIDTHLLSVGLEENIRMKKITFALFFQEHDQSHQDETDGILKFFLL